MIKPKRIARLLEPHRFALASDVGDSFISYKRPADIPELWEGVVIHVGGKRGEAVSAHAIASVCYGRFGAGTGEDRYVPETGTPWPVPPGERTGPTFLTCDEDAQKWERLVAGVTPVKAREFAREVGPDVLARTAGARAAAARYLELFGTRDWRDLRVRLELRATSREVRRARDIATTPPTIQVYNGREFYTTIVLGIILYSDQVEGRQIAPEGVKVWPHRDPWSEEPPDWSKYALVQRIEILADRLLARYPETMPSELPDD